ncbi:uncharacterized protein LOC132281285 [Cornus florida]|uniref:uncharacterized protein LOC132281285 n=1 Tax=Cornus florida TaxID=4283 RepID=UPI00289632DA|nr:uncharacterized protein LOC132281285 [Cornus florida]
MDQIILSTLKNNSFRVTVENSIYNQLCLTKELINVVFPHLLKNAHSAEYITNRAILATKNDFVDKLNENLIEQFLGEPTTYYSFDKATDNTGTYYQEDFLNSLTPNGLPPYKLTLKVDCPIMLLRNLDPTNGLCNGTRLICRGTKANVINAEISHGQHARKQVLILRIPLCPAENEATPFHFTRKQFSIRLSFAMTINKAQGQTIPYVGVYLPEHVFSHGQLYVALSRGTSMSTTKVLVKKDQTNIRGGTYTKNVVYKEVLQSKSLKTKSIIKVVVFRRAIEEYTSGTMLKVVLMDDDGTQIQGVLFNELVTKFSDSLLLHKTYRIFNVIVKDVNPINRSVHKEYKLKFLNNTSIEVEELEVVSLETINFNFVDFKELNKYIDAKENGSRKTTLTLWEDFAENEENFIMELIQKRPIITVTHVAINTYKGLSLQMQNGSTLQINMDIESVKALRHWTWMNLATKGQAAKGNLFFFW